MENKTLPIPGDDRWIYCPAGCFPPTSLPGMISDSLILSLESWSLGTGFADMRQQNMIRKGIYRGVDKSKHG